MDCAPPDHDLFKPTLNVVLPKIIQRLQLLGAAYFREEIEGGITVKTPFDEPDSIMIERFRKNFTKHIGTDEQE